MKKILILFVLVASIFSLSTMEFFLSEPIVWNEKSAVFDVLKAFGEASPKHKKEFTEIQVKQGHDIVYEGRTLEGGKRSKRVSKYYECTTCHNQVQEDPDLRFSNADSRLPYVKMKGIPFLQGTTFKGIVNRETWYNDDYVKKYGDEVVGKAHHDLRESIQLCAIECSQGRPMKDWELDAVTAYYWSLEFTLEDLDLSNADFEKLNAFKNESPNEEAIAWLKSFYLQKSPATFYDAPPSKWDGYKEFTGDKNRGEDIYKLSCLHCHHPEGVSHYTLEDDQLSLKDLKRTLFKDSHFSLYQIIPYGTYAIPGHRPYMPHYPMERMSTQQVEDLRAYIEYRTNNK